MCTHSNKSVCYMLTCILIFYIFLCQTGRYVFGKVAYLINLNIIPVCVHSVYVSCSDRSENPHFLPGCHSSRSAAAALRITGSFSAFSSYYYFLFHLFISFHFICLFFLFLSLFLYFCLSPGWVSEWVVGRVASSLTAVWEPSCHSRSSLVPLSFWSQSPLI